jgi:bifunctional non-homologous end joining protein LigD
MTKNNLKKYEQKRSLDNTPEPKAHINKSKKNLIFVIQRHDARHLHFDLRLELDGVLKSWAVPKGPPLGVSEKRLAIMVEDHPYSYKDFAGTIPKGNYGAGEVEIWDHGTYSVPGMATLDEIENYMHAGLKKGHISFILHGEKLNNEYTLIRTSLPGAKQSWLWFMKSQNNILDDSYISMPQKISPMLAFLIKEPFDRDNWIFEVKWDGYRALAYIKSGDVKLLSRNFVNLNKYYGPLVTDLNKYITHDVILDGEIVVLDAQGKSQFQLLQNYQEENSGHLFYYVFDLLYFDGHDLRNINLLERKALLEQLLAPLYNTHIRYSDHIEKQGIKLFKQAQKLDLEGIVAKNIHSAYKSGRSKDWLKIKTHLRQEAVIGGYTAPRGARQEFGSLMLGVYQQKKLVYIGNVGTGFSDQSLQELALKLAPLVQEKSPFTPAPKSSTGLTFVKPKLVCEVSFTEWTSEGHMRHPVFHGLRTDKKATDVGKEQENDG